MRRRAVLRLLCVVLALSLCVCVELCAESLSAQECSVRRLWRAIVCTEKRCGTGRFPCSLRFEDVVGKTTICWISVCFGHGQFPITCVVPLRQRSTSPPQLQYISALLMSSQHRHRGDVRTKTTPHIRIWASAYNRGERHLLDPRAQQLLIFVLTFPNTYCTSYVLLLLCAVPYLR